MNYNDYDRKVDDLFAAEEYGKALDLLWEMKKLFPEKLYPTLVYMLACYEKSGASDEMARIIGEALDLGVFFRIDEGRFFNALKDHGAYKRLNGRCLELREKAQETATSPFTCSRGGSTDSTPTAGRRTSKNPAGKYERF